MDTGEGVLISIEENLLTLKARLKERFTLEQLTIVWNPYSVENSGDNIDMTRHAIRHTRPKDTRLIHEKHGVVIFIITAT